MTAIAELPRPSFKESLAISRLWSIFARSSDFILYAWCLNDYEPRITRNSALIADRHGHTMQQTGPQSKKVVTWLSNRTKSRSPGATIVAPTTRSWLPTRMNAHPAVNLNARTMFAPLVGNMLIAKLSHRLTTSIWTTTRHNLTVVSGSPA